MNADFFLHQHADDELVIFGELDMDTAPLVLERLRSSAKPMTLRLESVTFADSSGLSALVVAAREFGARLGPPSPRVQIAARYAGVDWLFDVTDRTP